MELRILGPLEAVDDAGSVLALGGRKQRIVLAALATSAEVVSTDRLIDCVWGDDPPPRPEATLQVYVSTLRKILHSAGAEIERRPPGYRLVLPPASLDLERFTTLAREARSGDPAMALDRYDRAAALWRGPFLADLADEPFVQVESVHLVEQRHAALVGEMEALLGVGRPDEAVSALRNLTSAEPGDERWWSLLMRALYDAGRPADAAAVFAEAREALAEESGLDPSPALSEVHQRILRHDTAVPPVPVSGRPLWQVLGAELVGRDELVDSVRKLVEIGETVSLVGAPGVGKSAVAAAVGLRVAATPGSTVAFVSLDDRVRLGEATPPILDLIRNAVGVGRETDPASVLQAGRDLVVLDGGEDLAADLRELLSTLSFPVLLARRSPLGAPAESVIETPALDPPAARQLFRLRAARWPSAASSALDDDALLDAICAAVDRLPLGVELAAAQLRSHSPMDLRLRLEHRVDRLADPDRPGPLRHRSLGAAFAGAVETLGQDHLDDLVQAAVFRGGWNLDAYRAVVGVDAVDRLEQLVSAGLVWPDRSGLRFRYRIPAAVADLVAVDREVRTATVRTHAAHFAGEALRWRMQRGGFEAVQAAQAIALDAANVEAAMQNALRIDDDLAAAVTLASGNLFYTPTRLPWFDARLAELVQRRAGSGQDRHRLLVMYGHTGYLLGRQHSAVADLRSGMENLDPADDLAIRARTILAQVAADLADPEAVPLARAAVSAAEATGRPALLSQTLDSAVFVAIMTENLEQAQEWAMDKLNLELLRRDDFGRSFTLLRLSWIAYLSENDDAATDLAEQARTLAADTGNELVVLYATAIAGQAMLSSEPQAALGTLAGCAVTLLDESVPLDVADAVMAVAGGCALTGQPHAAVRLAAAADRRYVEAEIARPSVVRRFERPIATAADGLGDEERRRAERAGRMMPDDELRAALVGLRDGTSLASGPGA